MSKEFIPVYQPSLAGNENKYVKGGMVLTIDDTLYDRAFRMKGKGLAKHRIYWHDVLGYDFGMTNNWASVASEQTVAGVPARPLTK